MTGRHTPVLSVLDRLLDDAPEQSIDPPASEARTLSSLSSAIRRDLEGLLNAPRPWIVPRPHQDALSRSLLTYGLRDVTARVLSNQDERARIRDDVESTIRRFDPRLAEIRVTLLPDDAPLSTRIRLHIEGFILIDPEPEFVRYSTAIVPPGQRISVHTLRDA
ncbi:type VI secretion system baseplate subunit TssE [Ameyamaea chiangmaiensis]|uniref:Type VI secretion system baseplate subunit TssE n=1 Tax=Ameyamaea chiangmaiensis TaxID=442969 RepID=A0A850P8R8_9PROT|nr:type VI secretion system baseplate subunit TssE [Ameyamaea chiangmaiensis]MBS4076090.1 type VI secretion system baseplate subunit TssE [Ameyamaea chiangmaiensis]NVN40977.1 type VI secretion system baseplate subunit TssE [Ameyamaea chiangmaiensis]